MKLYINDVLKYSDKSVNYCNTLIETDSYVELALEAANSPHSYIKYDTIDNRRSKKDFAEAYAIAIDFDNKDNHDESTIKDFENSILASKYNYILYTSRSHTVNENCYHVAFLFSRPITDVNKFQAIGSFLKTQLQDAGLRFDTNANLFLGLNPSRFSDEEDIDENRFEMIYEDEAEFLDIEFDNVFSGENTTENTPLKQSSTPRVIKAFITEQKPKGKWDRTQDELTIELKFKMWTYICGEINKNNKKAYYQKLKRKDWINCGVYLKFHFDEAGKDLFRILSAGHPNDTEESIYDTYDSISLDGEYISVGLINNVLMDNDISIRKCLSFYLTRQYNDKKEVRRVHREIIDEVRRKAQEEYECAVVGIKPYAVSESEKARTQGFILELEDGRTIHKKYKLGELKRMYKAGERIEHSIVVNTKVHRHVRKRNRDVKVEALEVIITDVKKRIVVLGYLGSRDLSQIIKIMNNEYQFTQSVMKEYFSKEKVVAELVSQNILLDGSTERTRPVRKMRNAITHYKLR